jgi:hypothetical protein
MADRCSINPEELSLLLPSWDCHSATLGREPVGQLSWFRNKGTIMIDSSHPILQFVVQDDFQLRLGHLVGVLRLLLNALDKFKLPFDKRIVMTCNSSLQSIASPAATSFSIRVSLTHHGGPLVPDAVMEPVPFLR